MYKIWCLQRQQYFADGAEFDSLEDVRDQLIDYHSIDCDEESLHEQSLADILSGFEWEVHDLTGAFVEMNHSWGNGWTGKRKK